MSPRLSPEIPETLLRPDRDQTWTRSAFFAPHGEKGKFRTRRGRRERSSTLLFLGENLPVLTSLQRRAGLLWSPNGTVARRGCRLGLQPPRGVAPPRADMRPGSALLGPARLGFSRLLSALFGPARLLSAPFGSSRPRSAPLAAPRAFASLPSLVFLVQLIHSVVPAPVSGLPSLR